AGPGRPLGPGGGLGGRGGRVGGGGGRQGARVAEARRHGERTQHADRAPPDHAARGQTGRFVGHGRYSSGATEAGPREGGGGWRMVEAAPLQPPPSSTNLHDRAYYKECRRPSSPSHPTTTRTTPRRRCPSAASTAH